MNSTQVRCNPLLDFAARAFDAWRPLLALLVALMTLVHHSALADATDLVNPPVIEFDRDVISVLTKVGCNSGACHGAATGRGGFRLSLYGSRPEFDYRSIVREQQGRRIDGSQADRSLIIRKPIGELDHGGGQPLDDDPAAAEILQRWISEGAKRKPSKPLRRLTLRVPNHIVDLGDATIAMQAIARFDDGVERDVTRWTVFTANDSAAIEIDARRATATVRRPGRHVIIGRYLDQTTPLVLLAPFPKASHERAGSADAADTDRSVAAEATTGAHVEGSVIDRSVNRLLDVLHIQPKESVEDLTYLRRVSLDLIGRLPTPAEQKEYLASSDRRTRWVDRLLASDDFERYWTLQLAKLFRVGVGSNDDEATLAYSRWLREQVQTRTRLDELVRSLLLAEGDTHVDGAANFYRVGGGARAQAEFVAEALMGVRLRCANCHDHPLDRWKQDDYHGLAAILATVRPGRIVRVSPTATVIHPGTIEPATPRIPGRTTALEPATARNQLADWLTSDQNPFFAKTMVNRLWKQMMGQGLFEPVDDLRDTNPASHPELLVQLAEQFADNDFDPRYTLREIALSTAYARGVGDRLNESQFHFEHALTRNLPPEVMFDAVCDVTGVSEVIDRTLVGLRAVELYDARQNSLSLEVLGRCANDVECSTSSQTSDGLTRQLHLLNGRFLNDRIHHPDGRLFRWLEDGKPSDAIVSDFYQLALTRLPSDQEKRFWQQRLKADNPAEFQQRCGDFLWALLTCREFVTNH